MRTGTAVGCRPMRASYESSYCMEISAEVNKTITDISKKFLEHLSRWLSLVLLYNAMNRAFGFHLAIHSIVFRCNQDLQWKR